MCIYSRGDKLYSSHCFFFNYHSNPYPKPNSIQNPILTNYCGYKHFERMNFVGVNFAGEPAHVERK